MKLLRTGLRALLRTLFGTKPSTLPPPYPWAPYEVEGEPIDPVDARVVEVAQLLGIFPRDPAERAHADMVQALGIRRLKRAVRESAADALADDDRIARDTQAREDDQHDRDEAVRGEW